jgi:TPR repeat protein
MLSGTTTALTNVNDAPEHSRLSDLPDLVGFYSYSREDDEDSGGALSALRAAIQRELRSQLGRSRRTFRLWQDIEAVAAGTLWEDEIKAAIAESVFFIPIVTPTAVNSKYCRMEFEAFLERERALSRTDLVFPLLYIRVPELEVEAQWRVHPVLKIIGQRQYVNWRPHRNYPVTEVPVRHAIEAFCSTVADALRLTAPRRPVATPPVAAQAASEPSSPPEPTPPQSSIDEMVRNGNAARDRKDYAEAMRWYRLAADQGNATAQNNIGWLYDNGWGLKQDYIEAMRWYRLAADQGNASAQNNIGWLYRNGCGVKQDYVEAMRWYRLAADQGNASAQNNIGSLYQNGSGVKQDYAEAMRWFRPAADRGNAFAQNNIGSLYQNGSGVKQDYVEAMRWYRLAADQGNATAQHNVGSLYANGQGVAKNPSEARSWMQKAADNASPEAKKWLTEHPE